MDGHLLQRWGIGRIMRGRLFFFCYYATSYGFSLIDTGYFFLFHLLRTSFSSNVDLEKLNISFGAYHGGSSRYPQIHQIRISILTIKTVTVKYFWTLHNKLRHIKIKKVLKRNTVPAFESTKKLKVGTSTKYY